MIGFKTVRDLTFDELSTMISQASSKGTHVNQDLYDRYNHLLRLLTEEDETKFSQCADEKSCKAYLAFYPRPGACSYEALHLDEISKRLLDYEKTRRSNLKKGWKKLKIFFIWLLVILAVLFGILAWVTYKPSELEGIYLPSEINIDSKGIEDKEILENVNTYNVSEYWEDSWIDVTEDHLNNRITVTVEPNNSDQSRMARLRFTSYKHSLDQSIGRDERTITIIQEAGNATYVKPSVQSMIFGSEGGEKILTVESDGHHYGWGDSESQTADGWLQTTSDGVYGSNPTRRTITVKVRPNISSYQRSGYIYFQLPYETKEHAIVKVVQRGEDWRSERFNKEWVK